MKSLRKPAHYEAGYYLSEVKFTGDHEQTIVAVDNGEIGAGVTRTGGLGDWEDGCQSGALRRAMDAGLVDMNDLVEIWRSEPIPEGPVMLRKAQLADVKAKVAELWNTLDEKDRDCFYGASAVEAESFDLIGHDAYEIFIEARKLKSD